MPNRLYLRVPSTNCEPTIPCHRYYFADMTCLDFNADVRCATCKHWDSGNGRYGDCSAMTDNLAKVDAQDESGRQAESWFTTGSDFGCSKWEPRNGA